MPYTATTPPIWYEVQGSGPALIFSHGLMMNGSMFDEQVKVLKKSFKCVQWDERAHGKTAQNDYGKFSYYDSAADLIALMDELKIKQAVLVGMSQGGYLSLRAALTYPERVLGLVLIDTQASLEDPEKSEGYKATVEKCLPGPLPLEVRKLFAEIIMYPEWPRTQEWVDLWETYDLKHVLNALNTLMTRDDISEKIKAIKVPALVIHGSDDRAITLERAEAMAANLNSEMFVIEGERHAPNMSSAPEVNEQIELWLAKHGFGG